MIRTLAILSLLALPLGLLACPGGEDEPAPPTPETTPAVVEATPEPTPEPVPDEPPVEETAEGAEEADEEEGPPPVIVHGEPWTIDEVQTMPMADRFTFWGWSADGRYYAFETYRPSEGAVECDMTYELFVIDAETDSYVDGGHVEVAHASPEVGPKGICEPPDLTAVVVEKRADLLDHHGILLGNLSDPVRITGSDRTLSLKTPAGKEVPVVFRVLHGTEEIYGEEAEAGAAYYLAFKHAGGSLLIEPGRRRRPYVLGYAPKHVFFSPTGRHAAILISTTRSAFEGTRSSWMTNGIALPDYL